MRWVGSAVQLILIFLNMETCGDNPTPTPTDSVNGNCLSSSVGTSSSVSSRSRNSVDSDDILDEIDNLMKDLHTSSNFINMSHVNKYQLDSCQGQGHHGKSQGQDITPSKPRRVSVDFCSSMHNSLNPSLSQHSPNSTFKPSKRRSTISSSSYSGPQPSANPMLSPNSKLTRPKRSSSLLFSSQNISTNNSHNGIPNSNRICSPILLRRPSLSSQPLFTTPSSSTSNGPAQTFSIVVPPPPKPPPQIPLPLPPTPELEIIPVRKSINGNSVVGLAEAPMKATWRTKTANKSSLGLTIAGAKNHHSSLDQNYDYTIVNGISTPNTLSSANVSYDSNYKRNTVDSDARMRRTRSLSLGSNRTLGALRSKTLSTMF
jgi:hypothetical protein